jgi:hypothetical protein
VVRWSEAPWQPYSTLCLSHEDMRACLERDGVAIVPGVLGQQQCDTGVDLMWEMLGDIFRGRAKAPRRDDPSTWMYMREIDHNGKGEERLPGW